LPKVAASILAIGGLCAVLGSLQTWMTVEIYDDAWQIPPALDALLGVACIVVAAKLAGSRRWAAIAGIVLGAFTMLSSAAWLVYAASNRFFAVFIILGPVGCFAGTVLAGFSVVACDRAERARARLASQGLDIGL